MFVQVCFICSVLFVAWSMSALLTKTGEWECDRDAPGGGWGDEKGAACRSERRRDICNVITRTNSSTELFAFFFFWGGGMSRAKRVKARPAFFPTYFSILNDVRLMGGTARLEVSDILFAHAGPSQQRMWSGHSLFKKNL